MEMEKHSFIERTFRLLRGCFQARSERAAKRFVPLTLEHLEDRCATALLVGATVESPEPWAPSWADEAEYVVDDSASAEVLHGPAGAEYVALPVVDWSMTVTNPDGGGPGKAGVHLTSSVVALPREPSLGARFDGLETASPDVFAEPAPTETGRTAEGSTTRLTVSAVSNGADGSLVDRFLITRSPADRSSLEVAYKLTSFGSNACTDCAGQTTIPPGLEAVEVSVKALLGRKAVGHQIAVLTLAESSQYQVVQPTATVYLTGSADLCPESTLLAAYRQGNSTEAFNALVERHRPAVLRNGYRVLGNWDDAEDVCQLTFLTLARSAYQLQTRALGMQATLAGWLSTVARNAAIALLRSRTRRRHHEQCAAQSAQSSAENMSLDLRDELDFALSRIPPALREAVRLRYLEGLSQIEAAQIVGCPRGTLAQRAANGIQRLRDILIGREAAQPD